MQGNLEDLIVAQMMGHSSAGILQTYAKAIDGCRRDAIQKLETLRRTMQDTITPSGHAPACTRLTD